MRGSMPKLTTRDQANRPSSDERVFPDEKGRLWSAALERRDGPAGALVYRCISDERQSVRARTVEPLVLRDAMGDELRVSRADAPRIGILS